MLSNEEKKAIEELWHFDCAYNREIKIVLNLIEKQSKEIEELKKDKLELINKNHVVHLKDVEKELREMKKVIDTKNAEIECLNVIHESYKEMVEENNFISKDKIKAKILECRKILYSFEKELELKANKEKYIHKESMNCLLSQISILQSLLEKE
jgi:hypothetical protein